MCIQKCKNKCRGKNKWTPGTLQHLGISPGKSFHTSNCGLYTTMFFPKGLPNSPLHVGNTRINYILKEAFDLQPPPPPGPPWAPSFANKSTLFTSFTTTNFPAHLLTSMPPTFHLTIPLQLTFPCPAKTCLKVQANPQWCHRGPTPLLHQMPPSPPLSPTTLYPGYLTSLAWSQTQWMPGTT